MAITYVNLMHAEKEPRVKVMIDGRVAGKIVRLKTRRGEPVNLYRYVAKGGVEGIAFASIEAVKATLEI